MPVRYRATELIPAPFVSVAKTMLRNGAGDKISQEYVYTITGTIVNVGNDKNSPAASGYTFGDMNGVLAEQRRIRELFAVEGGRLEIEAPGGGGPNTIDTFCTVDSVNFEPSTWTSRCDYTITLRSPKIESDDETFQNLRDFNEDWSIQPNINGTYVISHNLQATGQAIYGVGGIVNDPLTEAKTWCQDRSVVLSTDGALSYYGTSGILDLSNLISDLSSASGNYWNHSVSETIGMNQYTWSISETFLHDPSGSVREEYNISQTSEADDPRKATFSINGTVFGNANLDKNLGLRNTRASGYFSYIASPMIYPRLQTYISPGFTLNPVPTSRQVSYNLTEGSLNYTYSYVASSGTLFSDALTEDISVDDVGYTDVFAQIQVPGRANGPVVQDMNTVTLPERTVNINLTFAPETGAITTSSLMAKYLAKPNTDAVISALVPNNGDYYVKQNTESWNPMKKQYQRTMSWTINPEGASVSGIPTSIHNV